MCARTILLMLSLVGTTSGFQRAHQTSPDFSEPRYALDEPDAAVELDESLREISGLTVLPDGRLGAIQDEAGAVYIIGSSSGAVEGWSRFGKKGDFEAVEHAGESVFVLRSDGLLFELSGWGGATATVRAYETGLDEKNDTEGLGYDPGGNRLLIVCKEEPGTGLDDEIKAIYAFDLQTRTLLPEPVIQVDRDDLRDRADDDIDFLPSALAVHPLTAEIYLLSSTRPALAVLDASGRLQHVHKLRRSLLEQPEGIAFARDGTLFVASEGDEGPPMLYRFDPR